MVAIECVRHLTLLVFVTTEHDDFFDLCMIEQVSHHCGTERAGTPRDEHCFTFKIRTAHADTLYNDRAIISNSRNRCSSARKTSIILPMAMNPVRSVGKLTNINV